MDEYIDVKLDVFEHVGQRARLRKTLTVTDLIGEILREFDDIAADTPEKYAIYLKGMDRPLAPTATMIQLDIQPQDELVFEYTRQNIRRMLEPHEYAFLRDDATGRVYDIQWQPAIIGRPTNEAEHNIMLAVNLQLHPKGPTVSRKHAQLTFSGGRYYIETLTGNNPVFVNGKDVPLDSRRELKNGDRVQVGKSDLMMTFLTQTAASVSKPISQPISQPVSQPVSPAVSRPPVSSVPEPISQPVTPPPPAPQAFAASGDKTQLAVEGIQVSRLVIEKAVVAVQVGQRLELMLYPTQIGRDTPLLSGEKDVSRRHAEVNFDAVSRKFFVTDLQSTNGVFLDGVRSEPGRPYEIRAGMRIGLGANLVLRFEVA